MSRALDAKRYLGFGESQRLSGTFYDGQRLTNHEPRVLKGARAPEVNVGGVAPPRKALTSEAVGERRSRPFNLDKIL